MTLPEFQRYQLQFTRHIRNPGGAARPDKVSAKRMRVYTEIVFNNLESSVAACFPVAKKVLGIRSWTKLVRKFFIEHESRSPLFRQIPEEFLKWLEHAPEVPPYLYSLAHYEWVELAVATADVSVDPHVVDPIGDLLEQVAVLAPSMMLLRYDYPVHKLSPRRKPIAPLPQPVHLLVFRNAEDEVRFIELNPVTARLVEILQDDHLTGRQALQQIAVELAHPDPDTIIRFGRELLADLRQQGVIVGAKRSAA
ncbi:MAG TPA: putative DNA-binding domain-containing protein [Methylophilaceae bacterium]|nr:putative DNA-binding domain-containing protein [Methylophilaceae bacterium]